MWIRHLSAKQKPPSSTLFWWGNILLFGLFLVLFVTSGRAQRPPVKTVPTQAQKDANLIDAIKRKDLKAVTQLLQRGANANACDLTYPPRRRINSDPITGQALGVTLLSSYQPSALSIAACWGTPSIVRLLLEKGADLNAVDNGGNTPLINLLRNSFRHPDDWKIMLQDDPSKWRALNQADHPFTINKEMLKLLLERGAKVNVKRTSGDTPLILAITKEDLPAVKLLLAHGADVNLPDNQGTTPLMWAAISYNPRSLRLLLTQKVRLHDRNNATYTALEMAEYHKLPENVKILKKAGAKE